MIQVPDPFKENVPSFDRTLGQNPYVDPYKENVPSFVRAYLLWRPRPKTGADRAAIWSDNWREVSMGQVIRTDDIPRWMHKRDPLVRVVSNMKDERPWFGEFTPLM